MRIGQSRGENSLRRPGARICQFQGENSLGAGREFALVQGENSPVERREFALVRARIRQLRGENSQSTEGMENMLYPEDSPGRMRCIGSGADIQWYRNSGIQAYEGTGIWDVWW